MTPTDSGVEAINAARNKNPGSLNQETGGAYRLYGMFRDAPSSRPAWRGEQLSLRGPAGLSPTHPKVRHRLSSTKHRATARHLSLKSFPKEMISNQTQGRNHASADARSHIDETSARGFVWRSGDIENSAGHSAFAQRPVASETSTLTPGPMVDESVTLCT
jgi:hypothetical protein